MSVINTMLQDLELRRVELDRGGAYRYVRALPQARQGRHVGWVLGLGALLVLAVSAAFGPDLWKKYAHPAQAVTQTGTPAVSGVIPLPALPAPASLPLAGQSVTPLVVTPDTTAAVPPTIAAGTRSATQRQSPPALALTISRELLGREAPAPEGREPPPLRVPGPTNPERRREAAPAVIATASPQSATAAIAPSTVRARASVVETPAQQPSMLVSERAATPVNSPAGAGGEIKQINPQQRAENEFRRANELLHQGRASQAMELFAQVLAQDPLYDAARQALVAGLLRSKNTAEAERLIVERQALPPKSATFAMLLARLQAERGDNELALETLRASLAVAGTNPAYHATMAALLARLGQHAAAVAQYQTALRLSPQSGVWWMGLGLSLQAISSLPEAQEALRRARASDNLTPELAAFVEQRLKQMQ